MYKIKKGDTVKILLGKDNGKTGTVERILVKDGKVLVNGINLFKRHVRAFKGVEGGIIDLPKPLNLSNVSLVCPSCKKATRVGFKLADTGKVRVCKKCGKEIETSKNR